MSDLGCVSNWSQGYLTDPRDIIPWHKKVNSRSPLRESIQNPHMTAVGMRVGIRVTHRG